MVDCDICTSDVTLVDSAREPFVVTPRFGPCVTLFLCKSKKYTNTKSIDNIEETRNLNDCGFTVNWSECGDLNSEENA